MKWQNHGEHEDFTKSQLQIQSSSNQNLHLIHHRNRKKKNTLKWIWNCKRLQIDKKNKSNAGRITIPSLKIQYRGIVSKTEWYRQKTDMWVSLAEEGHQNQVLLPQTEMRSKWKDPTCETRDRDCQKTPRQCSYDTGRKGPSEESIGCLLKSGTS